MKLRASIQVASILIHPRIMSTKLLHLSSFFTALTTLHLSLLYRADVGTAASYSPSYLPSGCYGSEATEFPSSNLFAAAGDGIWDNGAACGRQYLVRCISAEQSRTCIPDQSIQIKIVDYAATAVSPPSATGSTLVLSDKAFGSIANSTANLINIEFQQSSSSSSPAYINLCFIWLLLLLIKKKISRV